MSENMGDPSIEELDEMVKRFSEPDNSEDIRQEMSDCYTGLSLNKPE